MTFYSLKGSADVDEWNSQRLRLKQELNASIGPEINVNSIEICTSSHLP